MSSTFVDHDDGWMYSANHDQGGFLLTRSKKRGMVAITEVDLSQPNYGPNNLGDFHSMIERHRSPVAGW